MPLYTYRCPAGHETEALVKHDGSDAPTKCPFDRAAAHKKGIDERKGGLAVPYHFFDAAPLCEKPLERVMSLNAKSFPGADSWRK